MSNWIGAARSNYVRVKDVAAFKQAMENLDVEVIEDGEGRVGLIGKDPDCGGWPIVPVGDDEQEPFDPALLVCPHMLEGEVFVTMEAGHERSRYVTGCAAAYTWDGRTAMVNLNDIYAKIAQDLGVAPQFVTPAEY